MTRCDSCRVQVDPDKLELTVIGRTVCVDRVECDRLDRERVATTFLNRPSIMAAYDRGADAGRRFVAGEAVAS